MKCIVSGLANTASPEDIDRSQTERQRCAFACMGKWEARHITTQAQPHTGLFTSTADASTPCCLPGASMGRWACPVTDLKGERGEVQGTDTV